MPPSAWRNRSERMKPFDIPAKPGVWAPPPMVPARVEKDIPQGVSPVNSRFTTMTPFTSGRTTAMHSKQPQQVMGNSMSP